MKPLKKAKLKGAVIKDFQILLRSNPASLLKCSAYSVPVVCRVLEIKSGPLPQEHKYSAISVYSPPVQPPIQLLKVPIHLLSPQGHPGSSLAVASTTKTEVSTGTNRTRCTWDSGSLFTNWEEALYSDGT